MTAVGTVINRGEVIPADVLRFEDYQGDEWVRGGANTWDCLDPDGQSSSRRKSRDIAGFWAPLIVLAVAE